jgi:hypothetical protein
MEMGRTCCKDAFRQVAKEGDYLGRGFLACSPGEMEKVGG